MLFFVTSSDFFPNITLAVLKYRIFQGKQGKTTVYCFAKINKNHSVDDYIDRLVEVDFLTGNRDIDKGYSVDNVCLIRG